jgi:hypothetical protein
MKGTTVKKTLAEMLHEEGKCADPSPYGSGYCIQPSGHPWAHSNVSGAWAFMTPPDGSGDEPESSRLAHAYHLIHHEKGYLWPTCQQCKAVARALTILMKGGEV